MATQIKITELSSIDNANLTQTTLFPGVNMVGTPLTQKVTLEQMGNVVLTGAGGTYFPPAAIANISYNVVNAAQPNITSVGTLTSLSVSGNITVGGGNITTKLSTGYNVARQTNLQIDDLLFRVASDGKGQVSLVSGNANLSWSGYSIVSGTHAAFNSTGEIVTSGSWANIAISELTSVGDTILTTIQNTNQSHIYRITFMQTANLSNASVIVEKLI